MASPEEWSWHFDGTIRPFRHGLVLGVEGAFVESTHTRRSIFVYAFPGNRFFSGRVVLEHCLRMHLDGRVWEDVLERFEALRAVARAEYRDREVCRASA